MTLDDRVVLIIGTQALTIARLETEKELLQAKLREYEAKEAEQVEEPKRSPGE